MKIKFNAANINATVQTDAGEDIYSYSAEKLDISLDTTQAIAAFEELFARAMQVKGSIDDATE